MKRLVFILLQAAIVLPVFSQSEIKTSGLSEVEKLSVGLNKERSSIRHYMDSTILAYNKAVEIIDSKRSMVQNRAYANAERSESGQRIISEINALRNKRATMYDASNDWIESRKSRQEDIENELDERKGRCESLQKQANISEITLKLSKAAAEMAGSTYKNFGGEDNYENYRNAVASYNKQLDDYNNLYSTLSDEVDEYNSLAKELDYEYNSISDDVNNYTDETNASLSDIDSEIASRQSELDNLKASYFDRETGNDPYYGAARQAQLVRDFEESGYYDLISAWYGIDFYIGSDIGFRSVSGDAMTKEGMAICNHTGQLFDTLCARITRFEHAYFRTLSSASYITVSVDGKDYPDISFFSMCLSEEPSHVKEMESFKALFSIADYKNCEDFFNKILNLDELAIDPDKYPLEDLSFLNYFPSLKYLDIKNSSFKSFQPLFDIGYSGRVNISGAENFTTSELKDICRKLHNEYGAECIYKD